MENKLEKKIEVGAIRALPQLEHIINSLSKAREIWIDGAKSPEAKEYWQQGMYNGNEVKEIVMKFNEEVSQHYWDKEFDNKWFEQNKKK